MPDRDGHAGRVGVTGRRERGRALAGFVAFGVFWGTWGAVLPAVQEGAHAGEGQLGVALLMIGLGALLSMRLTGRLVDRFGARVQPVAMAAFGVAGVLPGLAGSPGALIVALLVLGAAAGATDVAINAAGVLAEERTGRPVLNLAHACFSACVVLGSLATAGLRALGAGPMLVLGLALLVIVLLAVAVLARPVEAAAGPAHGTPPRSFRRWRVPGPLLLFGVLGALAYLVENAWQSWGAVYLQTALHSGAASLAPAVFASAAAVGRAGGNVAARTVPPVWLLVVGALLGAAGTALAAGASAPGTALAGIAVAGLGTSVCAPTIISVAGRWAGPAHRGAAVSTVTTVAYLGFVLGPAAVGLTAAATDLPLAMAGVAAVALLLAIGAPAIRAVAIGATGSAAP